MIKKLIEKTDTSKGWNVISAVNGVICVGLFVAYLILK